MRSGPDPQGRISHSPPHSSPARGPKIRPGAGIRPPSPLKPLFGPDELQQLHEVLRESPADEWMADLA